MAEVLHPNQVVSAKLGKCYVIIDGVREHWLNVMSVKVTANIASSKVTRLGAFVEGSRATGMGYSGTMEIYHVNSRVNNIIQRMADTGLVPYFDIQTVIEDPTPKNGRDVQLVKDCHLDGDIDIASINGDEDFIKQTVGFKASGVIPLEKFKADHAIVQG